MKLKVNHGIENFSYLQLYLYIHLGILTIITHEYIQLYE